MADFQQITSELVLGNLFLGHRVEFIQVNTAYWDGILRVMKDALTGCEVANERALARCRGMRTFPIPNYDFT